MDTFHFGIYLFIATLLGSLIGLERQWRQRFAGLRTNALVAAGSAMYVGVSLSLGKGGDPDHMAGQIITGIGFLGAGVIFKEGFNVRGLNTAATIWCSAAVGVLSGLGYLREAGLATLVVIAINVLLRPVAIKLNQSPASQGTEMESVYRVQVFCADKDEPRLRALLLQSVGELSMKLKSLHSENLAASGGVRLVAELMIPGRDDKQAELVTGRMSVDEGVRSVSWEIVSSASSFE